MSARQRRRELIEIIASGLERAVAERASTPDGDVSSIEVSGVDGLALSPESRLSVRTGVAPDPNGPKAGERT